MHSKHLDYQQPFVKFAPCVFMATFSDVIRLCRRNLVWLANMFQKDESKKSQAISLIPGSTIFCYQRSILCKTIKGSVIGNKLGLSWHEYGIFGETERR